MIRHDPTNMWSEIPTKTCMQKTVLKRQGSLLRQDSLAKTRPAEKCLEETYNLETVKLLEGKD
jgi:hypothetical protein